MPVTRRSSTAGTTVAHVTLQQSFRVKKKGCGPPIGKPKNVLTSPIRACLPEIESPRKRHAPKQETMQENVECSPTKKVKSKVSEEQATGGGILTPRKLNVVNENLSPLKLNIDQPAKKSTVKRSKSTKRKTQPKKESANENVENSPHFSPAKENIPTPIKSPIPQRILMPMRALNFSPDRKGYRTPDVANNSAKKARALNFSPERKASKIISPERTIPDVWKSPIRELIRSPIKERDRTPQKPLLPDNSPAKRCIFGSPIRDGFMSPPREGFISPLRQLLTPTRHNLRSPPRDAFASPAKRNLLSSPAKSACSPRRAIFTSPTRDVRLSPRKNLTNPYSSPCMKAKQESPRRENIPADVRQSPRKNFTNPYSSPSIRLAKQEIKHTANDANAELKIRKKKLKKVTQALTCGPQDCACYAHARQALHTALPDRLLCREKELGVVQKFIDNHVHKGAPGSMYISGAPGTGKTAVLSSTMKQIQDLKKCPIVYVNCMACKNSTSIYNKVLSELKNKNSSLSAKEANLQLIKVLTSSGPNVVLILDEVDQLDSKNQEVLYTMFEWPALPKSRLILIGIANSLDLTDRILPRLQARPKCKPTLLNFPPYSKDQLVTILKDRLSKVEFNGNPVMEATAIQFCARKVASVAGDMRKALDICRRSVELVEAEVRKQQILKATGCPSPCKANPFVPKKITVAHIARIVGEVYGSRVTSAANQKQGIPLQEKLALCTVLLMLRDAKGKQKEVPLGKLHEKYIKVCKQQQVSGHTDLSDFLSMCMLSESKGIILLKKAKDPRSTKVSLKLDEKELEHALQDKVLISAILKKGLPQ